jgi:hypothetical protein
MVCSSHYTALRSGVETIIHNIEDQRTTLKGQQRVTFPRQMYLRLMRNPLFDSLHGINSSFPPKATLVSLAKYLKNKDGLRAFEFFMNCVLRKVIENEVVLDDLITKNAELMKEIMFLKSELNSLNIRAAGGGGVVVDVGGGVGVGGGGGSDGGDNDDDDDDADEDEITMEIVRSNSNYLSVSLYRLSQGLCLYHHNNCLEEFCIRSNILS